METNEIKLIWKTLAENKLVDEELARENIQRILANRSSGILKKFVKIINRDILITWILLGFLTGILIFLYFFSQTHPVEVRAPFFILAVMVYFLYKQYRDLSKKRFLKNTFNTESIRDSLLGVKNSMHRTLKEDGWMGLIFIMAANAFAIFVYYKWVFTFSEIDFTKLTTNTIAFYILIFLVLFFLSSPWTIPYFWKRKYAIVLSEIDKMLNELNEEKEDL
jgi:hypothetical protein